ncbi:MAG: hypothetical protein DRH30_11345 [Deltaproteobacteria bacterium]|nr:MAG: hypothetical protein DRH30_11345 [Deltaproteobacteria bacterium]
MKFVSALRVSAVLGYPVLVYVFLEGGFEWILMPVVALILVPKIVHWGRQSGASLMTLAALIIAVLAVLLLARTVGGRYVFLSVPVFVNLSLLGAFGATLFMEQSMVERLARMQVDGLSSAEVHYCRQVTFMWCSFFVLNAGATVALSIWGGVDVWALYTGLIAYLLIGVLFVVEYLVRKARFRRFEDTWIDRLLHRLFGGADTRS